MSNINNGGGSLPTTLVYSDITGITGAGQITNVVSISSADYANIGSPDPNTLYAIIPTVYSVAALVVGGGGGSSWGTPGYCYGPGGAGGTVRYVTGHAISSGTYSVVVGAGGTGTGPASGSNPITAGGTSSFDSIIATGGNGVDASANGASNSDYSGGLGNPVYSGGGAGAGGNGQSSSAGANGGIGVQCDISGTMLGYGGGGGGNADSGASGLGVDGGGNAGYLEGGTSGVNGRGGGGGGRSAGGNGGSGVVIIAYPTGSVTATGGTVTTSGGNTIHTFTTSDNFVVS